MEARQTDVLICGAGPAGLALAIELGSRGIDCTIVERNHRVGTAPRAKTTHTRTREFFRRWGIADDLAALAPFGIDYPADVHFVTRLSGHKLATISDAFNCAPTRNELYAEHAQWIPQYLVEEVMRRHAESFAHVTFMFGNDFLSADQDASGVSCRVRESASGEEFSIRCRYLVGADGARSIVRDIIGAQMEGRYGLAHAYNIVFRAPTLSALHDHGPGIMYWQTNPEVPGVIGPMDKDDLWYFMPGKVPGVDRVDLSMASDLIKRSTGLDFPFEVLSAEDWAASEFIADHYSRGRIFLIGDACHLHPPTGGYGMNMGIADSVDLGWKLAAVLQGWGGADLLGSYEQERKPVHRQVIDAALSNFATVSLHLTIPDTIEEDSLQGEADRQSVGMALATGRLQEFRSLGVMLGYSYAGSPVVASEGCVAPPDPEMRDYNPSAQPGSRAPHAWLADGRSLYDLFGEGFTLLGFGLAAETDLNQARQDAVALGIPLEIVRIDDDRIHDYYERRLALIRPDQHVAWRGDAWAGASVLQLAAGFLDNARLPTGGADERGKDVRN